MDIEHDPVTGDTYRYVASSDSYVSSTPSNKGAFFNGVRKISKSLLDSTTKNVKPSKEDENAKDSIMDEPKPVYLKKNLDRDIETIFAITGLTSNILKVNARDEVQAEVANISNFMENNDGEIETEEDLYRYTPSPDEKKRIKEFSHIKYMNDYGEVHRKHGKPAYISISGEMHWKENGLFHRDGDLPAVIESNGDMKWYKNGVLHRDNGKPAFIKKNGDSTWFNNGKIHRENDLPAVVHISGEKHWCKNGTFHRDNDQPAMILADDSSYWYRHGVLHRDSDKPAVQKTGEYKAYYKNGFIHRDNDLPAIIFENGTKFWFNNGLLHRDNDLPSVELFNGTKVWYQNGRVHRDNSPAYLSFDGTKIYLQHDSITRSDDLPAVELFDGTKIWAMRGKAHRVNKPAYQTTSGSYIYAQNGMIQSIDDDTPAVFNEFGTFFYGNGHIGRKSNKYAAILNDGYSYRLWKNRPTYSNRHNAVRNPEGYISSGTGAYNEWSKIDKLDKSNKACINLSKIINRNEWADMLVDIENKIND